LIYSSPRDGGRVVATRAAGNSGTCCRIYLGGFFGSMIRERAGIEVGAPAFGDA
jgi:hypothetical protein